MVELKASVPSSSTSLAVQQILGSPNCAEIISAYLLPGELRALAFLIRYHNWSGDEFYLEPCCTRALGSNAVESRILLLTGGRPPPHHDGGTFGVNPIKEASVSALTNTNPIVTKAAAIVHIYQNEVYTKFCDCCSAALDENRDSALVDEEAITLDIEKDGAKDALPTYKIEYGGIRWESVKKGVCGDLVLYDDESDNVVNTTLIGRGYLPEVISRGIETSSLCLQELPLPETTSSGANFLNARLAAMLGMNQQAEDIEFTVSRKNVAESAAVNAPQQATTETLIMAPAEATKVDQKWLHFRNFCSACNALFVSTSSPLYNEFLALRQTRQCFEDLRKDLRSCITETSNVLPIIPSEMHFQMDIHAFLRQRAARKELRKKCAALQTACSTLQRALHQNFRERVCFQIGANFYENVIRRIWPPDSFVEKSEKERFFSVTSQKATSSSSKLLRKSKSRFADLLIERRPLGSIYTSLAYLLRPLYWKWRDSKVVCDILSSERRMIERMRLAHDCLGHPDVDGAQSIIEQFTLTRDIDLDLYERSFLLSLWRVLFRSRDSSVRPFLGTKFDRIRVEQFFSHTMTGLPAKLKLSQKSFMRKNRQLAPKAAIIPNKRRKCSNNGAEAHETNKSSEVTLAADDQTKSNTAMDDLMQVLREAEGRNRSETVAFDSPIRS